MLVSVEIARRNTVIQKNNGDKNSAGTWEMSSHNVL